MRVEFTDWIFKKAINDDKIIFLTGDLGFNAFERMQESLGDRFINVGVCEQNMISVAAGLAKEGLKPFCYSIAPFAVFRPAEQIRLDVGLHNLNVKIVGNGGGYGYGIMGATHHAIEDFGMISSFQNFSAYVPYSNEDVKIVADEMALDNSPSYLRLGHGSLKGFQALNSPYQDIRKLVDGRSVTILGIGPVLLNAVEACVSMKLECDVFAINRLPWRTGFENLVESLKKTGKLLIVEEHVLRGGLGEAISYELLRNNIDVKISHSYSKGYPNGLYGSQSYHQKQSGLDPIALSATLKALA